MFRKSLSELIREFTSQNEARREKIETRITEREAEANQLRAKIQSDTQLLVQAELDESADAAEYEKSIRAANIRLHELDDLIAAYRAELEKVEPVPGALAKIRKAARREYEKRMEGIRTCRAEQAELENQLKQLENQLEQKKREESLLRAHREAQALLPLLEYIEPRAAQLPMHTDRERWLELWVSGNDAGAEDILARAEARKAAMAHTDQGREINIYLGDDSRGC